MMKKIKELREKMIELEREAGIEPRKKRKRRCRLCGCVISEEEYKKNRGLTREEEGRGEGKHGGAVYLRANSGGLCASCFGEVLIDRGLGFEQTTSEFGETLEKMRNGR